MGAVVVNQGKVVGQGAHQACGQAHAEVNAIIAAGDKTEGATIYVSLEPCCHQGRTPPCTDLIIQSGIRRVVFAETDSDSRVAHQGEKQLREAGLEVTHLPIPEITQFYQHYHHWQIQQCPWVTAKLAMSLDGCIAGPGGEPVQLTGTKANDYTHQQRRKVDAILTTDRTIKQDNPKLNARLSDTVIPKRIFVIDTRLDFDTGCQLVQTAHSITLLHGENASVERANLLKKQGIHCVSLRERDGRLVLEQVVLAIGQAGIHHLWVEAGGNLLANMIQAGLVHEAYYYVAPTWLGDKAYPAFSQGQEIFQRVSTGQWKALGDDALYHVRYDVEQDR